MITSFRNVHYFLSNMYPCLIVYNNTIYYSAEQAFQAQKTLDENQKALMSRNMDGFEAKRLGRKLKLRKDWIDIKDNIMYEVVKAKFKQNKDLAKLLKETDNEILIEVNTWKDTYWGVCDGKGLNKLGKILMRVREEI